METKSPIKSSITRRAWLIHVLFILCGVAVVAKILYIQYGPDSEVLRKRAEDTRTFRMSITEAERGDVYSYDGRLLATTLPSYDLRMDFRATGLTDSIFDSNIDSLSLCMANFFKDKSKERYKRMFRDYRNRSENGRQRVFKISPRNVSYFELISIKRFPVLRSPNPNKSGFIPEKVYKRVLPYGSIALRTIGRRVNDSVMWGIEGAFDDYLKGIDGITKMQRISGSFWMPVSDDVNREPINGIDVISTIDPEFQDVAERTLREQLQLQEADWGTAVLMEVETGEIRAMANLSRRSNGDCVEDLNHAIAQRINPGSTFKLPVLMVLLEDAKMSLEEVLNIDGGDVMMYGKRVRDSHLGYEKLTLRQVFEVSSNVGFARAVNNNYRQDQQRFVDQLVKMGINDTIPFQLQGFKGPYVHTNAKKWSALTLTSMSYGYELEMTPMQTLCIYNAVANGGKMIAPIVVKELRQYGQTLRTYNAEVIREKIASDETIKKVQACLVGVATVGTGRNLKIKDLNIAIKTGTAQMPNFNKGYGKAGGMDYLATIVGYFPADNPKYTCIVAMKTFTGGGRGANYYGGSLAGPVFKAIAERVYGSSTDWLPELSEKDSVARLLPSVKRANVRDLKNVLNRVNIEFDSPSSNGFVDVVDENSKLKGVAVNMPDDNVMPDVMGMGLRDAMNVLQSRGITVIFKGKGKVVNQSIVPGIEIKRGTTVYIILSL